MALATRVACDKEGNGDKGKSNGNEDGEQAMVTRAMATAMARAPTWAMVAAMRLAGNKEGKGEGSKGNGDSNEGGGQ